MIRLVVLSCVLAAASASAGAMTGFFAPIAYATTFLAPSNYRGPLSLAPGQPANIIAADGRPLDTLDVNLDRAAHFTTKALSGHFLKKRSVSLITPFSAYAYSAPLLTPYNYRGPLSLAPGQPANILAADGRPLDTLDVNVDRAAHFTAKALSGHILKKRSVSFVAPVSTIAYSAPLLTPYNYRGPLSLAPGQPANIIAADGRPLDTLDVNIDRAAHLTAKILDRHLLKKRSVAVVAPASRIVASPIIAPYAHLAYGAPLAGYISPISYAAPIAGKVFL